MKPTPLTVAELAAWLGMTPGGLRSLISRHGIEAAGKRGRAKVYLEADVAAKIGRGDRAGRGRFKC